MRPRPHGLRRFLTAAAFVAAAVPAWAGAEATTEALDGPLRGVQIDARSHRLLIATPKSVWYLPSSPLQGKRWEPQRVQLSATPLQGRTFIAPGGRLLAEAESVDGWIREIRFYGPHGEMQGRIPLSQLGTGVMRLVLGYRGRLILTLREAERSAERRTAGYAYDFWDSLGRRLATVDSEKPKAPVVAPDGRVVALLGDADVRFYDPQGRGVGKAITGRFRDLSLGDGGKNLFLYDADRPERLLYRNEKEDFTPFDLGAPVVQVRISPDGLLAYAWTTEGQLRRIDPASKRMGAGVDLFPGRRVSVSGAWLDDDGNLSLGFKTLESGGAHEIDRAYLALVRDSRVVACREVPVRRDAALVPFPVTGPPQGIFWTFEAIYYAPRGEGGLPEGPCAAGN